MNYKTQTHYGNNITGTSLQGYVDAPYSTLVRLFGKPLDGDGYKVDAEWILTFEDGAVATIYNWKNGPSYCGEEGTPVEDITEWHIGGYKPLAALRVKEVLEENK